VAAAVSNPYPGLRAFDQTDAQFFFGRDQTVDRMVETLRRKRLLAVTGPSGCGKSSLVRAGLLPALSLGVTGMAGQRWREVVMKPGSSPIRNLAEAIVGQLQVEGHDERSRLEALIESSPQGLSEWLRDTVATAGDNILIVVDQFEEVFRFSDVGQRLSARLASREETEQFVAALLQAVRQEHAPIYVLLTLRLDFLGECANYAGLSEAINEGQFLIPRMTREQCEEAIVGPAQVLGGHVEPALANEMLNDMARSSILDDGLRGAPDQLPLMQHVLARMWNLAQTEAGALPVLTLARYHALGGVSGALGAHLDSILEELGPDDRPIVERLFRRLAQRRSEGLVRDVRRPIKFSEAVSVTGVGEERLTTIIDAFAQPGRNFLVVPAVRPLSPDSMIDIAHESLIRQWPQLLEWVDDEEDAAENYLYLERTAKMHQLGKSDLLEPRAAENYQRWWFEFAPTESWAARYGDSYNLTEAFLNKSVERLRNLQRQERLAMRRRMWQRFFRAASAGGAVLVALVLVSVWYGLVKYDQERSQTAARNAINEVDQGLVESAAQTAIAATEAKRGIIGNLFEVLAGPSSPTQAASVAMLRVLSELQVVRPLRSHRASVQAAVFGVEDQVVITGSMDQSIIQHQLDGASAGSWSTLARLRAPLIAFSQHPRRPYVAALRADNKVVVIGMKGQSGPNEASLDMPPGDEIAWIGFSPRDDTFATIIAPTAADPKTSGKIKIWELIHGDGAPRIKRLLRQHDLPAGYRKVLSAAFSVDGEQLAIGADDAQVHVIDVETGREEHTLTGHSRGVLGVTYSRDGSKLATFSFDGTTSVWAVPAVSKLVTYAARRELDTKLTLGIFCADFDAQGERIATGDRGGLIRVWSTTGQVTEPMLSIPVAETAINVVKFSGDGQTILYGTSVGAVGLIDLKAIAQHVSTITAEPLDATLDRARVLIAADQPGPIVEEGEPPRAVAVAAPAPSAQSAGPAVISALSPAGDVLAWADDQGNVFRSRRDGATQRLAEKLGRINGLAFRPDGRRLAVLIENSRAQLIDLDEPTRVTDLGTQQRIAFLPGGSGFVTLTANGQLLFWKDEASPGPDLLNELLMPPAPRAARLAVSVTTPAGDARQFLIAVTNGSLATVIDVAAHGGDTPHPTPFSQLKSPWGEIEAVAFSPDGKDLVIAAAEGEIIAFDLETSLSLVTYRPGKTVKALAFSADGAEIDAAGKDFVARYAFAEDTNGAKLKKLRKVWASVCGRLPGKPSERASPIVAEPSGHTRPVAPDSAPLAPILGLGMSASNEAPCGS
jgi:WD40 repeat protein/energy-coupling factor transporter ATP-binding protein EcfA2